MYKNAHLGDPSVRGEVVSHLVTDRRRSYWQLCHVCSKESIRASRFGDWDPPKALCQSRDPQDLSLFIVVRRTKKMLRSARSHPKSAVSEGAERRGRNLISCCLKASFHPSLPKRRLPLGREVLASADGGFPCSEP